METFVPFNIANKLKEKGFTLGYNIYGYKPIYADVDTIVLIWNNGAYEKDYFGKNIPCPTISQVLKWLRNKKDLYLGITYVPQIDKHNDFYFPTIQHIGKPMSTVYTKPTDNFKTYEEAAFTGIEYIINNLI
jgi:hypothetical protein